MAQPHYITEATVIGQVSPDLITSYFAPKIESTARQMMEDYAGDLLNYEDELRAAQAEAQVGQDGTVNMEGLPNPPPRPLFHSQPLLEDFSSTMTQISEHFMAKSGGWRVGANAARFERMLDEKYGVFRPFITNHPEVERFVRGVQRQYAMGAFSPLRTGPPPIPRTTAIVILFMMKRGGVQWEIILLASLFFLVGLQPWALVALVALFHYLLQRRKRRPIGTMPTYIAATEPYYANAKCLASKEDQDKAKLALLRNKVGTPLAASEKIDTSQYDTVLLGYGPPSLYTAALLARAGRKVLVLSPRTDASGCLVLEQCTDKKVAEKYEHVPFDTEASNVAKISGQQAILAPALCSSTDYQGGVRFAQIGSPADGHAFEILSIPGVGTDRKDHEIPIILKADPRSLIDDAATYLGDGWPDSDGGMGHSAAAAYVAACESMNASASLFYLTKILPDNVNNLRSDSTYQESAIRFASGFLDKCFPLNPHVRSLMAGIGMKGENLKPNGASMAVHVTNICAATSGEGMHYPIGGPRALSMALATVIEQNGGRILTGVVARELIFDEDATIATRNVTKPDEGPPPPRCVGVQLSDGREVRFERDRYEGSSGDPAIISMGGFIDTFIRLLPEDVRSKYKVPRGLPALSERRPVFKVLFALRGSAEDLDITGADFYRLPNASIAQDEFDSTTGNINFGEIGGRDEKDEGEVAESNEMVEAINKDPSADETQNNGARRSKKGRKTKFHAGVNWLHVSFASAKDPSFALQHGRISTCVVTIEADDDFITEFDTKPRLFVVNKETAGTAGDRQRLIERVARDLIDLYPQLEGKIEHCEARGPYHRGLSHNPERYAAKGVRADTPYPNLFVGGSDLTVGESFSGAVVGGWLVANAVMGYQPIDHLFIQKNITADIEHFLERPSLPEEEDLAVPYDPTSDTNANEKNKDI